MLGKTSIVNALAKLHNFCINEHDIPAQTLKEDMNHIINHDQGYIEMTSCDDETYVVPAEFMNACHNFHDAPRSIRRLNSIEGAPLPRTVIHDFIANGHWE